MRWLLAPALIFAALVSGTLSPAGPAMAEPLSAESLERLLRVPKVDYRLDWVFLGSFSVLADDPKDGAKGLHDVYAPREAVEAYRRTGTFPDGTVLVKDVFLTKTEPLTTGTVSYADRLQGRFVLVKDSTNQNASRSPLWGDGWGWAFFEGDETDKTVTTDYRKDCLGCHEPARSQDFLYTRGYTVLRR